MPQASCGGSRYFTPASLLRLRGLPIAAAAMLAVLCLSAIVVPHAAAQAPDYEWPGEDGDWDDAGNWTGAAVPGDTINDGHIRFSGNGGLIGGAAGDVGSNTGIGLLDFDSAGGSYTIDSTGSLTFGAGGQILNNSLSTQTIAMDINSGGAPGFAVDAATADVHLTGTITLNDGGLAVGGAGATNITGTIQGTGGLTKSGVGTLTLTGTNTYEGGTAIQGGTLSIADGASLGDAAGGLSLNGGTLHVSAHAAIVQETTLEAGGGTVAADNGVNVLMTGKITGIGQLVKTGDGNLLLFNSGDANDYSGGTLVQAGTLVGDSTSLQGAIENNAVVNFDQASSGTYAGAMTGSGSLLKTGNAELTLTGANTYSGGTTVQAGTLRGNAESIQGDVAIGASGWVTFDQDGVDGAYSDQLSGTGGISKLGNAVLTIDGASNTFEGTIYVDEGVLRLANPGTLGDPNVVDIGYDATLDLNGTTQTLRDLRCYLGGNVLLGGGTLNVGRLSETLGVLIINLGAGGQLNVGADNSNSTLAGVVSGNGTLTKLGDGTLTLTGINTFTGQTNVADGTLVVNGSLASAVQVAAGATLAGTGTVGSLTVNGTIAPGNSIGTMNVAGNYTHNAGATYAVEINDAGQSDRIHATGTATIQGGHVEVAAASGSYSDGATYTILQADGGRTGAFDSISHNLPFFNITLQYFSNAVGLLLESTVTSFASIAETPNQRAVGTQLDLIQKGPTGDFLTVIQALQSLNREDVRTAMDHIGGEPYANLPAINLAVADALADRVLYRLGTLSCNPSRYIGGEELWAYALGGWERQSRRQPYFGYDSSLAGFMIGIDQTRDDLTFGLASAYAHKNTNFDLPAGNAADFFNLTTYAAMDQDGHHLHGGVGYTYGWNAVQRIIEINGLPARIARSSPQAGMLSVFGRYGLDLPAGRFTLTPTLGFRAMRASMLDANESGAESLNLTVAAHHRTSVASQMGAKIAFCPRPRWRAEAYAEWDHQYGHRANTVPVAFDGGVYQYIIAGTPVPRDAARLGAMLTGDVRDQLSLYLNYDALLSTSYGNHNVAGGLTVRY